MAYLTSINKEVQVICFHKIMILSLIVRLVYPMICQWLNDLVPPPLTIYRFHMILSETQIVRMLKMWWRSNFKITIIFMAKERHYVYLLLFKFPFFGTLYDICYIISIFNISWISLLLKSVGPILGTARLKKDVVCKIKIFDSKWKTDQGIFLHFNYVLLRCFWC